MVLLDMKGVLVFDVMKGVGFRLERLGAMKKNHVNACALGF